jgi:hypothetical protein
MTWITAWRLYRLLCHIMVRASDAPAGSWSAGPGAPMMAASSDPSIVSRSSSRPMTRSRVSRCPRTDSARGPETTGNNAHVPDNRDARRAVRLRSRTARPPHPERVKTQVRLPDVQPGEGPADQHPLNLAGALEDCEDLPVRPDHVQGATPPVACPCGPAPTGPAASARVRPVSVPGRGPTFRAHRV